MSMRTASLTLLSVLISLPGEAAVRHAFVTSTSGNGNLSMWAGASGTGAAAADAVCNARASAVLLAGTYVAWLSTSTDDAYCRVHGLTGKRTDASPCGQGSLPTGAGPWVMPDGTPLGTPFALATPDMVYPKSAVLNPPRRTELGTIVHDAIWTGTDNTGAAIQSDPPATYVNCGNWTSGSNMVDGVIGNIDETGWGWTNNGQTNCSTAPRRLLCLEVGAGGDPLPARPGGARLAFVTSTNGKGKLSTWANAGGLSKLEAADQVCRSLAAALPYPNSFVAWLSTAATDAIDRIGNDGAWMRLDRVRVAGSIAELIGGTLASPINVTETGEYVGNHGAWTGTSSDGNSSALQCSDWDSESGSGDTGSVQETVTWSFSPGGTSCDTFFHIYCLQDLAFTFYDGFEWGDTTGWPAATP